MHGGVTFKQYPHSLLNSSQLWSLVAFGDEIEAATTLPTDCWCKIFSLMFATLTMFIQTYTLLSITSHHINLAFILDETQGA